MAEVYEAFTLSDFDSTLASCEPGDRIIYYRGLHAAGSLCRFATRRAGEGYVTLVQRRLAYTGQDRFQYEAQRTNKRFR